VLREVALIAAEDTRHSQRLMQHFGIARRWRPVMSTTSAMKVVAFITRLLAGDDVALISDAGTPLISDPGYHLVRQARAAGINVVPVPGACALIAALSAAGCRRIVSFSKVSCRPRLWAARTGAGQGRAAHADLLRGAPPYP
jgi:16S rRNA (cytidine1402-2'-O)-methyltransferase